MWIDVNSSANMKHVPRFSLCALHKPVSTTTDRGLLAKMYSAASCEFVTCETPNKRLFCMPSWNGLSNVPGSDSTTSTKVIEGLWVACVATRVRRCMGAPGPETLDAESAIDLETTPPE